MTSRRDFLVRSGFAVVGGLTLLSGFSPAQEMMKDGYFRIPPEVLSDAFSRLRADDFTALIGGEFEMVGESGDTFRLELVEVVDSSNRKQPVAIDSYLLIFEIRGKVLPPDGIYKTYVPQAGEVNIAVTSVGLLGNRMQAAVARIYV